MPIEVDKHGSITVTGSDGMDIFRMLTLKSSLSLYLKTGIKPTRGVGLRQMLDLATEFTGKKYKGSKPEGERALADLAQIAAQVKPKTN